MRASDTDRDAVAERLAGALSEGRLDMAEYDARLSSAMNAKTLGELEPLTADLPAPASAGSGPVDLAEVGAAGAPTRTWQDRLEPWRGLAGISIILIGIWTVTSVTSGELLPFWPAWPLSFMLIFTVVGVVTGSGNRKRDGGGSRNRIDGPDSDR
ncbi:DUF1707 SHOCT-like domain-containing protein [Actinorugispora endophytica]|nr:DUF1707 domain-containing protein [Actinorugispora endophytica]